LLNSSNQIQHVPPNSDEIEVSLFGPGIGECCVIHLGDNEWLIIDSCLDPSTKNPTPLLYLQNLDVDPMYAVKLFVVSHWHSDHIKGASEVAGTCESSYICFSEALLKYEFLALVDVYSGLDQTVLTDRETCGTKEIASIIKTIKERCEQKNADLIYNLLSADKRIFQRQYSNHSVEVWALSPSSESVMNCLAEIGDCKRIAAESPVRRVIPVPTQNHNAAVLLIKVNGESKILLGSDLEETGNPRTGWSAIVQSQNRPQGKSQIFKIPHHGSADAHSHDVWEKMLDSNPIGILTSKVGGRAIPRNSDIKRLKEYTSNLYCTAPPLTKKHKYDPAVEKTIKGVMKNRKPLYGEMGHIQIRFNGNSGAAIGLIAPAKAL